jgi:outer membrane protein assembly factor BamB
MSSNPTPTLWHRISSFWNALPELTKALIVRRVALVAGIYCLALSVLLSLNLMQGVSDDPLRSQDLAAMKSALVRRPADENLKQRIRALDLELRSKHATQQAKASWGGWLLLGGGIVFLAALKSATYRKKLPRPAQPGLDYERANAAIKQGQGAIGVLTAVLVGNALYFAMNASSSLSDKTLAAAKSPEPATAAAAAPAPTTPFPTPEELNRNWPRFRGPNGAGIASSNIVTSFNPQSGDNILWKTTLPLFGPNSPVIWDNRVFLTGSSAKRREVYCLDSGSGKILWQQAVETQESPKEPPSVMEETGGYSPSTAAVDGRRVYAMFANGDVAAFDYQGKQVWARSLGKPDNSYGHATSLEMYQDRLLIQFDQGNGKDGKSKLLALNTATGQTAWESQSRPVPNSWSTPLVIQAGAKPQIITCANPWVIAYDPTNGSEIWRAKALYGEVTPSPIFAGGLVLAVMEGEKLSAIKPDGTGDVSKTHVAWSTEDGLPDICSPLSDGQRVYLLTSSGTVTCYQLADGKKLWEKELDLSFHSSPSLVGDRLWLITDQGLLIQAAAAPEFKELSRTDLGDEVLASPAFAEGKAFIRGKKQLIAVGKK